MDMVLLFQAFIVGVLCYLGAVETVWAYGVVGGYYILGRPLVAGFLIGLVFGDVQAGVLCGLAVYLLLVCIRVVHQVVKSPMLLMVVSV